MSNSVSYAEIDAICRNYKHHLYRWRLDPVAFCFEAFQEDKVKPLQYWQAQFFWDFARNKKEARAAGHGVGKSFVLGRAAWWVFITQKIINEQLKIPCTGPSGSNIEDVLWAEFCSTYGQLHGFLQDEFTVQKDKAFHNSKLRLNSEDEDAAMKDGDAWFARLRTSSKERPEALQGFHGNPSLFIIDEAPGVPDEVFEVAQGAMAGANVFGIMFGNPRRNTGYFFDSFHEKASMWHTGHVSCVDNTVDHEREYFYFDAMGRRKYVTCRGRTTETYINEMKGKYGENSATYAYRVLGQFPTSEEDSLIHSEWIDEATKRTEFAVADAKKGQKRYMGVDVAYMGGDWSGIVVRCGPEIEHVEMWHGNDPVESASRVAEVFNDMKNSGMPVDKIFVDDIGVGAGVTATLRHRGLPAIPVTVSESAPIDGGTKCKRMRDWLWWQCRLYFQRKRPRISESEGSAWERLIKELKMPNYTTKNGPVAVETKDSIKKRLRRSPDIADALCLTFYRDNMSKMERGQSSSDIRRLQKDRARRMRHGKKKSSAARWKIL